MNLVARGDLEGAHDNLARALEAFPHHSDLLVAYSRTNIAMAAVSPGCRSASSDAERCVSRNVWLENLRDQLRRLAAGRAGATIDDGNRGAAAISLTPTLQWDSDWDSDQQLSGSDQQLRYTYVQQAINAARLATSVDPMNPSNWENVSAVYAALIGWGRNADKFAILAAREAAHLSPGRPESHRFLAEVYSRARRAADADQELTGP